MKTYSNKISIIEIDKPSKKKISIETILLILFLIIIFTSPFIINQKKELPDGTLISRNRLTGEICIKMANNKSTCFQKDNPFYKEISDLFNNY